MLRGQPPHFRIQLYRLGDGPVTCPTRRHSVGPSTVPSIYCVPPLHPTRLSTDARTILQCVFGPRCGRAALRLQPWPLNNALTEEVQEGRIIIDGFSKNSASGSTPPQSCDLWPPINIPAIWQTALDQRVGPLSQFNNVAFVGTKTKH